MEKYFDKDRFIEVTNQASYPLAFILFDSHRRRTVVNYGNPIGIVITIRDVGSALPSSMPYNQLLAEIEQKPVFISNIKASERLFFRIEKDFVARGKIVRTNSATIEVSPEGTQAGCETEIDGYTWLSPAGWGLNPGQKIRIWLVRGKKPVLGRKD